jgi:hypothetical protein
MCSRSVTVGNSGAKCLQRVDDPLGRQHHVERQVNLGLEPLQQSLHFGAQIARPRHTPSAPRPAQCGPLVRQLRLGRLAIEQRYAELRFEICDRVADHRRRAVQLPRGACEASDVHDGQEDLQLVEGRGARVRYHIDFLECLVRAYASFLDKQADLHVNDQNTTRRIT